MTKLSYSERKRLPNSDFALPKTRQYPIENISHGRDALARASAERNAGKLSAAKQAEIDRKVHQRYPSIACMHCGSTSHKTPDHGKRHDAPLGDLPGFGALTEL